MSILNWSSKSPEGCRQHEREAGAGRVEEGEAYKDRRGCRRRVANVGAKKRAVP